jgi:hypothetical protein
MGTIPTRISLKFRKLNFYDFVSMNQIMIRANDHQIWNIGSNYLMVCGRERKLEFIPRMNWIKRLKKKKKSLSFKQSNECSFLHNKLWRLDWRVV